jgi:hypothetical protein
MRDVQRRVYLSPTNGSDNRVGAIDMTTPDKPADNCGPSRCSTAADVVHSWMRGEREYPGDSYVVSVMTEYMLEHVRQRHYGNDVLASSELDNASHLIKAIRSHFSL